MERTNYELEDLNNMPSEELQALIDKDAEGDGQLLYELETALMEKAHDQIFPGSETFNQMGEETDPERAVRVLVESLDFLNTLRAINTLDDLAAGADL